MENIRNTVLPEVDLSALPETNEIYQFLKSQYLIEMEYLSAMNLLISSHEFKKPESFSLKTFYLSYLSCKKAQLEEFYTTVLNRFSIDILEQSKIISTIMKDLNTADIEIHDRKENISKVSK